MKVTNYFQSYDTYFWQWEDNTEVVAIPNGTTIAYRELVMDVLEKLALQGLPPFGTLLLVIIATNPKGADSVDSVYAMLSKHIETNEDIVNDAIGFLKLVAELPQIYKEGKNRILLFQTLFERCHNVLSVKVSQRIIDDYSRMKKSFLIQQESFDLKVLYRDFRPLSVLKNRFQTVKDIISAMAQLPSIDEQKLVIEDVVPEDSLAFADQLIANPKTFHVGSLIKRIWSGLNIPDQSVLPSHQALGGVSDLTNKGDFDKLLISEFANDDITFLSL